MKGMSRRTFFKVVGQGMAYGLFPITLSECAPPQPQYMGSYHVPTPEEPLTPNDDFFIQTNTATQEISVDGWKLRLGGRLLHPRTLSFEDLLAFPRHTECVTLECIGNDPGGPLISSADFTGVLFRDLLEEVELAGREHHRPGELSGGVCHDFPTLTKRLPIDSRDSLHKL